MNYSDPSTVTLSAGASAGFAVSATYNSLDGGPTQTYAAPFVVSGSGAHTVKYWSVDSGGVYEVAKTLALRVSQGTDLRVSQAASQSSPTAGQSLTYTIKVTNGGQRAAGDVTVTDELPASLSFVSCAADNGGVCGGAGNTRSVTFASLDAGATATATLQTSVNCSVAGGGHQQHGERQVFHGRDERRRQHGHGEGDGDFQPPAFGDHHRPDDGSRLRRQHPGRLYRRVRGAQPPRSGTGDSLPRAISTQR